MSEKIRLSNDTVVDISRLSSDELAYLMTERELQNQIDQREPRRQKRQEDIDRFFGELTLRHQQASAECGEE